MVAGIVAEASSNTTSQAAATYIQSWLSMSNHRFWIISLLPKFALKFRQPGDLSNLEAFIQPPWLATIPCSILPRNKTILISYRPNLILIQAGSLTHLFDSTHTFIDPVSQPLVFIQAYPTYGGLSYVDVGDNPFFPPKIGNRNYESPAATKRG